MSIGKTVWSSKFNLGDVEYWVQESKFMWKMESDRVGANAVDNLKRTEVWFSEFAGRSSHFDML